MRHRGEHVGFHPFAVREYPLLVAARAEVPHLAGEGEDEAMPALIAVEPRKRVPWIAAGEETPDNAFLDTAAKAASCPQLRRMPGSAPAQRGQPLPGIYVCRCNAADWDQSRYDGSFASTRRCIAASPGGKSSPGIEDPRRVRRRTREARSGRARGRVRPPAAGPRAPGSRSGRRWCAGNPSRRGRCPSRTR